MSVVTLLNAVSANTTGPVAGLGTPYGNLTLAVSTTGTVSAFSVVLQGSLDGFNFEAIGSAITSTTAGTSMGTGVLFQYFQAVLSGYSGTGTVTVELAYSLESAASGGGGPPAGAAGGDLSGTYPDPTVAKVGGTAFSLPVSIANGGTGTGTAAPQNEVLAGPSSGGSGAPSFRSLVAADVPTLNQNSTGTAANLSGTPALPNGTTATTQTGGDSSTKLATTAFVQGALPGAASTSTAGILQLDGTGSDIQPAGQTASAGTGTLAAISKHIHPPGSSFLCTPTSFAPTTAQTLSTTSATYAAISGASSTVAAGSNGGEISQIATWSSPSAGVLAVANGTVFPAAGGTVNVAASGSTTAVVTYTGVSANTLTGCAYVSGSATGTVATGGAVTLTTAAASTGSFTAPVSGIVVVSTFLVGKPSGASAFGFALAAHGTVSPILGNECVFALSNIYYPLPLTFVVPVTPGSSYNFDLLYGIASSETLAVYALGQSGTSVTGSIGAPITLAVSGV